MLWSDQQLDPHISLTAFNWRQAAGTRAQASAPNHKAVCPGRVLPRPASVLRPLVLADIFHRRTSRNGWSREPPFTGRETEAHRGIPALVKLGCCGVRSRPSYAPLPPMACHRRNRHGKAGLAFPCRFISGCKNHYERLSPSACLPGRHSGRLAGKVKPQSPDSLSAPITRSNLGRAGLSWSQEEQLQTKTTGQCGPLTGRQLPCYGV